MSGVAMTVPASRGTSPLMERSMVGPTPATGGLPGSVTRTIRYEQPGGGLCALEIGCGQGAAVAEILGQHGLVVAKRRCDLAGIERCLVACLEVASAA